MSSVIGDNIPMDADLAKRLLVIEDALKLQPERLAEIVKLCFALGFFHGKQIAQNETAASMDRILKGVAP